MNELLGVLLGGVLTLVGSVGAVSLQARHQRKQARDKDLWDRRVSLYLDLLAHLSGRVSFAADSDQFLIGYGPKTAEDYQLRQELRARVALFASEEIRDLWGRAADAALHLAAETFEGGHAEQFYGRVIIPETSDDPEYTRHLEVEKRTRERLISRLRAELEVDSFLAT